MTKWWRKYWKEKGHVRKGVCEDFMGIDSSYIFKKEGYLIDCREDHFAFNNYDEKGYRILKVKINNDEFCFYILEDRSYLQRKLVAALFDDGFHVSFIEFFLNSSVGFPIITKRASYIIPVEKQQCNRFTFFHCPGKDCNQRMRKLYYFRGNFLCRKCLNLGYKSQRISPFQRNKRNNQFEKWRLNFRRLTKKSSQVLGFYKN